MPDRAIDSFDPVASFDVLRRPEAHRRPTMAADAVTSLREAIIFGDIPAGAQLRLEHVAASLGMSVSPVREALRQLVTLGLAELVPYRGARVTRLDLEQMHAIYQLRAAVEEVTVRWAAAQISSEQEAALRVVLAELDRANDANDVRAAVKGNTTFHYELAATSGSPWAERVLRPLLETTQRYSAAVQRSQLRQQATTVESVGHREILDACVRHDPDSAATALRSHLSAFEHEFDQALAAQATGDQQA